MPVSDDEKDSEDEEDVHAAGEPPKTAKQQNDNKVRVKLESARVSFETLMDQSLPISRSDRYDPSNPEHVHLRRVQKPWPWVIYGQYCLTNMAPNGPGGSQARFLERPKFHMWAPSKQAAEMVSQQFVVNRQATGLQPHFDVEVFDTFEGFRDSFRSAAALKMSKNYHAGKSEDNEGKKKSKGRKKSKKNNDNKKK